MVILKEMREKRNYSQFQLATASGIAQQTISAIESGARKNPGIETLYPLAVALGCKLDDLYVPEKKKRKIYRVKRLSA